MVESYLFCWDAPHREKHRGRCSSPGEFLQRADFSLLLSHDHDHDRLKTETQLCNAARTRSAMGLLQFWRKLYSLETLDTRFVIPSNTPPRVSAADFEPNPVRLGTSGQQNAAASPSGSPRSQPAPDVRPPLWDTAEFYVYYFLFVTVVPLMFYVPYTVSKRMFSLLSDQLRQPY